jgi:hypothetical protein
LATKQSTRYTATAPDGSVHTRGSVRTYTHCVVGRRCYRYALKRAKGWDRHDSDTYAYFTRVIAQGGCHISRPSYYTEAKFAAVQEKDVERAKEMIDGATTREVYVAAQLAKRLAVVDVDKAKGAYDSFRTLGWCGRRDLADKLAVQERSSSAYIEVAVLPID